MESLFNQDRLLTVKEVAEILDSSASTIYRKVYAGEIPYIRLWGSYKGPIRFDPIALKEWLDKQSRKAEKIDRTKIDDIFFPNRSGKDGVERINKLAVKLIASMGD